jgi:tyrosyl-tRNA synthetase
MYGKVMSWPDEFIIRGFEIATVVTNSELEQAKKDLAGGKNPKTLKMLLAYKVVEVYYGKDQAAAAEDNFKKIFEEKLNPDEIPEFKIKAKNIIEVLVETKLASSKSEARRLISQGGIKVEAEIIKDENYNVESAGRDSVVIQKGKRYFAKIIF